MSSSDALIWIAMATVAITVVAQLWVAAARAVQRRVRRRRYLLAAGDSRPRPPSADDEPSHSIGPERARAVRRQAELAARQAAAAGGEAPNPYRMGTPEFVLWVATYHLTLTEVDEERAADSPVRLSTAPRDPSLGRP